jgi:hypothetical protein
MKSIFVLLFSLILAGGAIAEQPGKADSQRINEKLLVSFKEHFPNAEQVAWVELPETYVVNFVDHGVRSHIVYDKDGGFISSTRYCQEQDLPHYDLNQLKKYYPGKSIFSVTEMKNDSGVEYYVKLEDDKSWMTVHIEIDGNFNVVERYRKPS